MISGFICKCPESKKPLQDRQWIVIQYKCNYSAFHGRRYTPSEYSAIHCQSCGSCWRTKAAYVSQLKLK